MNRSRPELSDEALADEVSSGQDPSRAARAAEELLLRYRERIYRWCLRSTRDHEAALDLTQEIQLKIHRSLESFHGRSRYSTWVFSIVRNACISDARRRRPVIEDDEVLARFADPRPGPDRQLSEREAYEELLERMRNVLTSDELDALWMRCVERMAVDDITQRLGIESVSGARGVLQSARRKLRASLEDATNAGIERER